MRIWPLSAMVTISLSFASCMYTIRFCTLHELNATAARIPMMALDIFISVADRCYAAKVNSRKDITLSRQIKKEGLKRDKRARLRLYFGQIA